MARSLSARRSTQRPLRLSLAFVLALLGWACEPGDPFPGRAPDPPPGRATDGLLERADLQALAEATLERDAAPLVAALRHADAAVRARAAYGLASVQDSGAVGALRRLLSDPEPGVRADAAFALGQTPGGVGPAVARALTAETDATVRRLLAEAIGKRGGEAELAALRSVADTALLPRATLALSQGVIRGHAPEATIDLLIERMGHADPRVRAAATYFVARAEPDVWWLRRLEIRAALADLDVDDPAAMYLIAGLGRRMQVFSREPVTRFLLGSSDWRIRANAAAALGAVEGVRVPSGPHLIEALDDPSPHVRLQAATALAAGGPDPNIVAALTRWMERRPAMHGTAAPLLPFLGRAEEAEVVLRRIRRLPTDRGALWTHALDALTVIPGEDAVQELGRVLREPVPESIARRAADDLVVRWELSREAESAPEVFLDLAERAAESPRPERAARLVPILTDPRVVDAGGAELLARLRERLGEGPARDTVEAALARARGAGALPAGEAQAADLAAGAPGGGAAATDGAGGEGAADTARSAGPEPASRSPRPRLAVDWDALRRLGAHPRLVLETEKGTIVLRLRTEEAPLTVQAIAALAEAGRYDGTPFHRVVSNFVVQGGDVARGDGTGGPGFVIRTEATRTPYERGVLGMASSGKDTEGSQFFVTHSMQPHLDGGYTAFGWVERGIEVVDVIEQGDRLLSARVIPGS